MSEVVPINIASIPVRVLTHKNQRKLTDEEVRSLLAEYVNTDTKYAALAKKYGEKCGGISEHLISNIVRGISYRDVPGIDGLRKDAQAKAKNSLVRWSTSEPVRVPDAAKTPIEVDFTSVESIDAAILRLQKARSLLIGPAGEVAA